MSASDPNVHKIIRRLFTAARTRPPGNQHAFLMMFPITRISAPLGPRFWIDPPILRSVALELYAIGRLAPEPITHFEERLVNFIQYEYHPDWFFSSPRVGSLGELVTDEFVASVAPDFRSRFLSESWIVLAVPIYRLGCDGILRTTDVVVSSADAARGLTELFGMPTAGFDADFFPARSVVPNTRVIASDDCWIFVRGRNLTELNSHVMMALGAIWAAIGANECDFSIAEPFDGYHIWEPGMRMNLYHPYRTVGALVSKPRLTVERQAAMERVLISDVGLVDRTRRRVACEFIYHHGANPGLVSFSNGVIALDALFGESDDNTERVSAAVGELMRDSRLADKTKQLFRLRGTILHGGRASIFQSSKYLRYVRRFGTEPQDDLAHILRSSLIASA